MSRFNAIRRYATGAKGQTSDAPLAHLLAQQVTLDPPLSHHERTVCHPKYLLGDGKEYRRSYTYIYGVTLEELKVLKLL